jgi:hypothetical protein
MPRSIGSRGRLVALASLLATIVVGVPSAYADDLPVDSTEDITAPVVTSVDVTPLSVDVRGESRTFTATLTAADDLSGVSQAQLSYRSAAGNQSIHFVFYAGNRTSGDAKSGTYVAKTTVTSLQANGTYTFAGLYVYDLVGNYRSYSTTSNIAPAQLTVQSDADAVPPAMTSIRVAPNTLDVSQSIQAATVEVDVTDDRSGVRYVSGTFVSPSGRQAAGFTATPVTGQPGLARGTTTVAQYSEPGEWTLRFVCAVDIAGNQQCFSANSTPSITAAFGATALNVVSNPADEAKPGVTQFRVSPTSIDVTDSDQTVRTDFDVADNLSGVQYAYVIFASPRTAGASPEVIQRMGWAFAPSIYQLQHQTDGSYVVTEDDTKRMLTGTISASTVFPRYDRSGDWRVDRVCVVDNVNWQTCYTANTTPSVSSIGPTGLTVEWNRTPVVAVTGITQSTYTEGSEPSPGCSVSDVEDGTITTVEPVLAGPDEQGLVTVTCSYTDNGGLIGRAVKTYTIVKPRNTPPVVDVTGVTETTYEFGSVPTAGCNVTDGEDTGEGAEPEVSVMTGPLAAYGLGTVTVTCSYTDTGGLSDIATVTYTVADTTAPALHLASVTTWATSSSGATVHYGATATDAVDANPTVVCTPPPGTVFAIGTTTVQCTATDAAGNQSTGSFTVAVRPSCKPSTLMQPINTDGSSVFKLGATISLKIATSDCYGTTADKVAPTVSLKKVDTQPDGVVNEVVSAGSANEGTTMRYDAATGQHVYNLSTKRSQFCATTSPLCSGSDLTAGAYEITVSAPEFATPVKGRLSLRR